MSQANIAGELLLLKKKKKKKAVVARISATKVFVLVILCFFSSFVSIISPLLAH